VGDPLADRLGQLQQVLTAAQAEAQAAPLSSERRAQLKEEIIALFRDADAALQRAQAVKDGAKHLAEQWKQLAPGHLDGETLLGWAQLLLAQLDAARTTLAAVLARDARHALAHATLGAVALAGGQHEEAGEHLSQAITLGTDRKATLYAHLYQGMLSRERGRFDDAEQSFRTALTLGPNLLQAWYELGETFWRSGRRVEAMMAWKTGAEANKFSPWGKRCAAVVTTVEQGGDPPRDV
jgi:tetratricopeptide (TPR) repeat protein